MIETPPTDDQSPARLVAGALAHLARHMETGCPRSAYLAAMLLERIALDGKADAHLRTHARQLVDILERDQEQEWSAPGHAVGRSNPEQPVHT